MFYHANAFSYRHSKKLQNTTQCANYPNRESFPFKIIRVLVKPKESLEGLENISISNKPAVCRPG